MNFDNSEKHLSDDEIGFLVQGKARKLLRGEKSRQEFCADLVDILAAEPGVIVRHKPLRSQGRCSFGRQNAGRQGTALFVPQEGAP